MNATRADKDANIIPMTPPKWYARAQIDSTIPIITLVKALATEGLTCKSVNGVLRIQEQAK